MNFLFKDIASGTFTHTTYKYFSTDILLVQDLMKLFKLRGEKFTAVNNLSFGVKNGECFGLLGVNGAGKTTSFRMLTGDEIMTSGRAAILGTR